MPDEMERLVSNVEALASGPEDLVVLTHDRPLPDSTVDALYLALGHRFPDRRFLILTDGLKATTLGQHRQLERIERSLVALAQAVGSILEALENLQDEEPAESRTLDGDPFPSRERDQSKPL